MDNRIAGIRRTPEFAEMNFADQYETQQKLVAYDLYQKPEFREAPEEYQKAAIDRVMAETYTPVYENPEAEAWMNNTKQAYLNGDPNAKQALKTFYQVTDVADNLPFLTSLNLQVPSPEIVYKLSPTPKEYQNNPMALNRTAGGDDNKARKEIEQLAVQTGDQETLDMIMSKKRQALTTAIGIGEEIAVAVAATAVAGPAGTAASRALFGAKAAAKAGRFGAWMMANAPQLAIEGTIEGVRGMADTVSRYIRYGEDPKVSGALVAFGAHAAVDMAMGAVIGGAIDGVRAAKNGYNPEVAGYVVDNFGESVAKGKIDIQNISMPAGLSEDQFRHLSSIKMTDEAYKKIDAGVSPSNLTELEQANIRVYNQGYDLTANTDGSIFVQPKLAPSEGRVFENTLRAEEWVGTQGSKYLEGLEAVADSKGMSSFIARNPQLNYNFARKYADDSWIVKGASKDFVQPSKRWFVSPTEISSIVDKGEGQFIRFVHNVPETLNKETGDLFVGNETLNILPAAEGNAVAFIGGPNKLADPNDIAIAERIADSKLKDKTIGKVTKDEIVRDELVRQGFMAAQKADGSIDVYFPDKIKIADTRVNPSTGRIGKKDFGIKKNPELDTIYSVEVGIDASEIAAKPKEFALLGTRILSGDVSPTQARRYAESYLKSQNINKKVKVSRNDKGVTKVYINRAGDVQINLPKRITDLKAQRESYNKLMRGLNEVAGGKGPKPGSYSKQFATHQKQYAGSFYSIKDFEAYAGSLQKLNSVSGVRALKAGGYSLRSAITKKTYHAVDGNQLMRNIAVNDMDVTSFKTAMEQVGYKVELDNGVINVFDGSGKGLLTSGTDHVEISQSLDFYPLRLPSSMAPDSNIISEVPTMHLQAATNISTGLSPELSAFLGNFEDYRRVLGSEVRMKKATGNTMLKMGKANYEVKIPKLNYTKSFSSEAEAKEFLETEWKSLATAQEAAQDKGMRVWYENGKFKLRKGNVDIVAKDFDDLQKVIGEQPNPTYAGEFIPRDVQQALDELDIHMELPPGFNKASMGGYEMARVKNNDWLALKDTTPAVFSKYGPRVAALRRLARQIDSKLPEKLGLNRIFENIHKDSRIALTKSFRDKEVLFNMFGEKGSLSKIIPQNRRMGITHYIEDQAAGGKNLETIMKDYGMTSHDTEIADQLMKFYKVKADEFGIPLDEMITGYQPHMRKVAVQFKEAEDTQLITKEFIASYPGTKEFINKKGFESFSTTFERLTDARKAWTDEDALSVALRYVNAAHIKHTSGKSWDNMYNVLKEHHNEIKGEGFITLMNSYKDALTHPQNAIHKSSVTKSLNNMTKKLGLGEEAGTALVDTLMSLPYMTSMAFRPWMPFRNIFQTFTILPLRTGSLAVSVRAVKKLMGNFGSTLDEMIYEGVIPKRSGALALEYQEMMKGNILEAKGKARQIYERSMEIGLQWYGLSDDFTRAVAYLANKELFEKGIQKAMRTGKFEPLVFQKRSRLEGLDPAIQEQVLGYIQAGNLRAAETTMARANIDATMFDYSTVNKPMGASGTMGHLFYQFGTYSVNFAQLMASSMKNGSVSSRVRGLIAMSAGMAIVSQGMKEAGVDNSSFLGYNMLMFNGGPYFNMAIDALESINPSVRGDIARKDLLRNFGIKLNKSGVAITYPSLAPGYMQFKYAMKAHESAQEGDYWGFWLAATSTPEHKSRE